MVGKEECVIEGQPLPCIDARLIYFALLSHFFIFYFKFWVGNIILILIRFDTTCLGRRYRLDVLI